MVPFSAKEQKSRIGLFSAAKLQFHVVTFLRGGNDRKGISFGMLEKLYKCTRYGICNVRFRATFLEANEDTFSPNNLVTLLFQTPTNVKAIFNKENHFVALLY